MHSGKLCHQDLVTSWVLFENQSYKGQRSSNALLPTAAGAHVGLLLHDLPETVVHGYPLTQGGASHT